jgi:hypothetical protein
MVWEAEQSDEVIEYLAFLPQCTWSGIDVVDGARSRRRIAVR